MVDEVSQPPLIAVPLQFSRQTGKSLETIGFQYKPSHVQDRLFPNSSTSELPGSLGLVVNLLNKCFR